MSISVGTLKVLSNETRVKILKMLKNKENKNVAEITKELNIPQPLVSYHLKHLKAANLISCEKKGRNKLYQITNSELIQNLE